MVQTKHPFEKKSKKRQKRSKKIVYHLKYLNVGRFMFERYCVRKKHRCSRRMKEKRKEGMK